MNTTTILTASKSETLLRPELRWQNAAFRGNPKIGDGLRTMKFILL